MPRRPPAGQPPPDAAILREAALAHLARYAASRAGLIRVLDRRIARWLRAAEAGGDQEAAETAAAARAEARAVADQLAAQGVVDDAAFAAGRARSLARAGRSRRAVLAHLAARGVDGATAAAAAPEDPAAELAAALSVARRRRIGPFRPVPLPEGPDGAAARRRELAILARAGFAQPVAIAALRLDPAAAEAILDRLRQA